MFYKILVTAHSWIAMLALLMCAFALFKSLTSWLGKQEFGKSHNGIYASAVGFLHLQLLLGLILYFISPNVQSISSEVMKNDTLRFYAVEHITGMILAIIIAQVARIISKKRKSHAAMFIGLALALLLIIGSMPWIRVEGVQYLRGLI